MQQDKCSRMASFMGFPIQINIVYEGDRSLSWKQLHLSNMWTNKSILSKVEKMYSISKPNYLIKLCNFNGLKGFSCFILLSFLLLTVSICSKISFEIASYHLIQYQDSFHHIEVRLNTLIIRGVGIIRHYLAGTARLDKPGMFWVIELFRRKRVHAGEKSKKIEKK